jgi:hypothetical protein
MFFSVNSASAKEGGQFVNYELLKLAKTMSGSELLLLRASFKLSEKAVFMYPTSVFDLRNWTNAVSQWMGHNLSALVHRDEKQLMEKGLMKPRNWGSDGNEEDRRMARLTDLGYQMCVNIRDYEGARNEVGV